MGFTWAGPSGVKFLREPGLRPEVSDPEDGDEGLELNLDNEPGVLLVFLNARYQLL